MRAWRGLAGLVLACVGLVFAATPAGANTVISPGAVQLEYGFDAGGPLPTLPAPADGRIATYEGMYQLTGALCAPVLGTARIKFTAPGGGDVCGFYLESPQVGNGSATPNATISLTGEVLVGGQALPLTNDDLNAPWPTVGGPLFAVAAPPGAAVTLVISGAGLSQSFSISEARRVGLQPPVLYRDPKTTTINPVADVAFDEHASDGATAIEDVGINSASLSYFNPGNVSIRLPSASDAFLEVDLGVGPDPNSVWQLSNLDPVPARDLVLVLPNGQRLLPSVDAAGTDGFSTFAFVFTVPATFTGATLLVTPNTLSDYETPSPGSPSGELSVRVSGGSFPIDFSGGSQPRPTAIPFSTPTTATLPGSAPGVPGNLGRGTTNAVLASAVAPVAGGVVVILVPVILIRRRRQRIGGSLLFIEVPAGVTAAVTTDISSETDAFGHDGPAESSAPSGVGEMPQTAPPIARRRRLDFLGDPRHHGLFGDPLPRVVELCGYITLNTEPDSDRVFSSDELRQTLGDPDKALLPETLWTYANRLRRAIGTEGLVTEGKSGYRLAVPIDTDWAEFKALRARADHAAPDRRHGLLAQALGLVRGIPFANVGEGRYRWALEGDNPIAEQMTVAIEQVAHTLFLGLRVSGDRDGAEAAARRGLLGCPGSLTLYDDLLRFTVGDPRKFAAVRSQAIASVGKHPRLLEILAELTQVPVDEA